MKVNLNIKKKCFYEKAKKKKIKYIICNNVVNNAYLAFPRMKIALKLNG